MIVKRAKKRRELSFGGDEILQAENMLQKEAYRTLKLAKAAVREGVLYCTVLYCTVLYCTVLYCTVLYCALLCVISSL